MVAWHGRLGTQFATMMCDGVAARFMDEARVSSMGRFRNVYGVVSTWRLCASCRDEYSNAHEMVDLQNITKMCVVCKVRWGTYGVPNKEKNGKPYFTPCKDLACHVALLSLHHHGINICTTAISHTLDSFRYYSSCR